jgi:HEAT repeat protein
MDSSEKPPVTIAAIKKMESLRDIVGLLELLDPTLSVVYRRASARALAALAPARAVPEMAARLADEPDRGVRQSLARGLGRLGDDRALPVLIQSLQDRDLEVCHEAALALSRFNSPAAYEALLAALARKENREDWQVRRFAAQALGKLGDRRAVPALIARLRDESDLVKPAVAEALGELGDPQAITPLKTARHTTPHRRGAECATCQAIDAALRRLAGSGLEYS